MKITDANGISEDLTPDQIRDLKRSIEDLENPVKYVVYSELSPGRRWRLFLNVSDDTWCDDINTATLFKAEHIAKVVCKEYSGGRERGPSIAKITTRNSKRKALKYFR